MKENINITPDQINKILTNSRSTWSTKLECELKEIHLDIFNKIMGTDLTLHETSLTYENEPYYYGDSANNKTIRLIKNELLKKRGYLTSDDLIKMLYNYDENCRIIYRIDNNSFKYITSINIEKLNHKDKVIKLS